MAKPTNKKPSLLNELYDNLNYLLSLNYLERHLAINKEFKELISNSLLILNALNKKVKTNKVDVNKLISLFEQKTKSSLDLKSPLKYKDKTEQIDYINYLKTYCLNIFKIDLNKKQSNKVNTPVNKPINIPQNNSATFVNNNQENPYVAINNFGGVPVEKLKERLTDRLNNSNQFLFDRKPKYYKHLKIGFYALNVVFFFFLVAYIIIMILLNGKDTGFTTGSSKQDQIPFVTLFRALILIFYCFILCTSTWKVLKHFYELKKKNKKINENFWYTNNKFQTFFTIVINVFVLVYLIFPNGDWRHSFDQYYNSVSEELKPIILSLIIITYALFALISLNLITLVLLQCFAPKFRTDLYQQVVMDEVNKIRDENNNDQVPPTAPEEKSDQVVN